MTAQAYLFPELEPPEPIVARVQTDDEINAGWEARLLSDMATAPVTTCYPGFTGAICERLVERGLVVREDAGFMPYPDPIGMMEHGKIITAKRAKVLIAEYWADPDPMFRYSLK